MQAFYTQNSTTRNIHTLKLPESKYSRITILITLFTFIFTILQPSILNVFWSSQKPVSYIALCFIHIYLQNVQKTFLLMIVCDDDTHLMITA